MLRVYSFVYIISPLAAFLFQPIMGAMSDKCESKLGRRRPFLLVLSIMSLTGITLILNGSLIGALFGDQKRGVILFSMILNK